MKKMHSFVAQEKILWFLHFVKLHISKSGAFLILSIIYHFLSYALSSYSVLYSEPCIHFITPVMEEPEITFKCHQTINSSGIKGKNCLDPPVHLKILNSYNT